LPEVSVIMGDDTRFLIQNADDETVKGFGDEWSRFDQKDLSPQQRQQIFDDYFSRFPWSELPPDAEGADIGCGSGRWALVVAPRVGKLTLIDASGEALDVARRNLKNVKNVSFVQATVSDLPITKNTLDFAYSLGVLHHVPDTAGAIREVSIRLKPGAPFLIYLYYAFDNRGAGYRLLWRVSDLFRRVISRMPYGLRYVVSQIIAVTVYWPLARMAKTLAGAGCLPRSWPLAYYRDKSFYVMRTDALDRFGTRLEQRFTREEITAMLKTAGFDQIDFSDAEPFWCAVARKT